MIEYEETVQKFLVARGKNPHLSPIEIGLMEDCFKRGTSENHFVSMIIELRNNPF